MKSRFVVIRTDGVISLEDQLNALPHEYEIVGFQAFVFEDMSQYVVIAEDVEA